VWPLDPNICRTSTELDFHSDPADELIAATSVVHRVPLATRGGKIRKSKLAPITGDVAEIRKGTSGVRLRKQIVRAILVLLALCAPFTGAAPAFDVASVKPNHDLRKGGEGAGERLEHSPTSVTMTNATLLSCVEWAWGVREYQVAGAPGWFGSEGFDIVAKTANPVSEDTLRLMMRSLLVERFPSVPT
jgi:hypothetical protein